jgi:glycosyltransferase involved in cell wall biosynthesis
VPALPRILIVVTLAEAGGAQTCVATLVPALVGRYDVTVAAYGPGPLPHAVRAAGASYVPLRHVRRPIRPWRDLLGLLELVRLVREVRPHVVHVNSSKAGLLGRLAAWIAGVPIRVYTVHGWAFSASSGPSAIVYRRAERLAARLTTRTVCVSEGERAAGLAARTCGERTTVVIRNGIDAAGRPVAHPGTNPVRLVTVGRLQAPKDPLTFIRALGRMTERHWTATLVGDGVDRPSVESEVRRLGLGEAVALPGTRDDVIEILAASQVFVLSSRSEALPVSILEAMAAGLPIVASRVGGVAELVVEGETGLLVPPGRPDVLAGAIERLIDDPGLRERMGAAARVRVEAEFAVDSFVAAHDALYRHELAHRGLPLPSP